LPGNEDLAHWLQEVGRRHFAAPAASACDPSTSRNLVKEGPVLASLAIARRPFLLTLFAIAFLQYYFADVMVKIMSLPSLIFFVFG
jgi:hypothetical protein